MVTNVMRPLDGVRIALACADFRMLGDCAAQVREWGALVLTRTVLNHLDEIAEACAVVVVFADGFEDDGLRACLDGLERWQEGPTLLVVTDRSPPPWNPKLERGRPAVVVARSEWTTRLLGLTGPPTDPELPFTD